MLSLLCISGYNPISKHPFKIRTKKSSMFMTPVFECPDIYPGRNTVVGNPLLLYIIIQRSLCISFVKLLVNHLLNYLLIMLLMFIYLLNMLLMFIYLLKVWLVTPSCCIYIYIYIYRHHCIFHLLIICEMFCLEIINESRYISWSEHCGWYPPLADIYIYIYIYIYIQIIVYFIC